MLEKKEQSKPLLVSENALQWNLLLETDPDQFDANISELIGTIELSTHIEESKKEKDLQRISIIQQLANPESELFSFYQSFAEIAATTQKRVLQEDFKQRKGVARFKGVQRYTQNMFNEFKALTLDRTEVSADDYKLLIDIIASPETQELLNNRLYSFGSKVDGALHALVSNLSMVAFPAWLAQFGAEYPISYAAFEATMTSIPIIPGLPGLTRFITYGLGEGFLIWSLKHRNNPNFKLKDSILHGLAACVDYGYFAIPLINIMRNRGIPYSKEVFFAILNTTLIGQPLEKISKKYNC